MVLNGAGRAGGRGGAGGALAGTGETVGVGGGGAEEELGVEEGEEEGEEEGTRQHGNVQTLYFLNIPFDNIYGTIAKTVESSPPISPASPPHPQQIRLKIPQPQQKRPIATFPIPQIQLQ